LRLSWNALCSAIRAAIVSGEFVGYETAGCCVGFGVLVMAIGCDGRLVLVAALVVVVRGVVVVVLVVVVVVVVAAVTATVAASAPTGPATVVISSSK